MNHRIGLVTLIGLSSVTAGARALEPDAASRASGVPPVPTPACDALASDPRWGLAGNSALTGLTAVITAATATDQAYCQVDFTDVSLVGPRYGYREGQTSEIRVRVGLPLNASDGGSGGVQGAWNGRIQSRGNGGF